MKNVQRIIVICHYECISEVRIFLSHVIRYCLILRTIYTIIIEIIAGIQAIAVIRIDTTNTKL